MKKCLAVILALVMLLAGCAAPVMDGARAELLVFAAASMTEAMNEIAKLYEAVAPDVKLVFNFDSSGTLKTQIAQGADCDIFISAGQKQMDQLDMAADASVNTGGLDLVLAGSRFNIVSNRVVLIVPEGADKGIDAFEDALGDKVGLIALGNADVPAGQYAEEIYSSLGLWQALRDSGKISYGSNVKEVLAQVAAGSVDCGVVYSTDAATAEGVELAAEAPAGSHRPIVYPAAIINTTKQRADAEAFMAFLRGAECAAVFEGIGFSVPARQGG